MALDKKTLFIREKCLSAAEKEARGSVSPVLNAPINREKTSMSAGIYGGLERRH